MRAACYAIDLPPPFRYALMPAAMPYAAAATRLLLLADMLPPRYAIDAADTRCRCRRHAFATLPRCRLPYSSRHAMMLMLRYAAACRHMLLLLLCCCLRRFAAVITLAATLLTYVASDISCQRRRCCCFAML